MTDPIYLLHDVLKVSPRKSTLSNMLTNINSNPKAIEISLLLSNKYIHIRRSQCTQFDPCYLLTDTMSFFPHRKKINIGSSHLGLFTNS